MMMQEKLAALRLPEPIAVVGMGVSGKSAFRYLQAAGYQVQAFDGKAQGEILPLCLDDPAQFAAFATLIVSPGIDRRTAAIASAGGEVINDVELFARLVEKPVLAVTGSNGKSTVVSMLAETLSALGQRVRLCGNIGRPVLEALFDAPQETDCYVVELSSYQLEVCPSLQIAVGAIVNITPDHLDRYDSFADYAQAKANLVRQSAVCVLNADDAQCAALEDLAAQTLFYGKGKAACVQDDALWLDGEKVLDTRQLSVYGAHNAANALVALLMLRAFGADMAEAAAALCLFKGLPHRMVLVGEYGGVRYLNDSKATNIGATAAALAGISAPIYLIAGGVGKNQDFKELAQVILQSSVKKVLLIGVDNRDMQAALQTGGIDYVDCGEMHHAVQYAKQAAQAGDWVLLSPATASFDQFSGYDARGSCFAYEVQNQCQ